MPVALSTADEPTSRFLSCELAVVVLEIDEVLFTEFEERAESGFPGFLMAGLLVLLSIPKVTLYLGFVEGGFFFEDFSHVLHLREVVGVELGSFLH